jgi:heparin binding hemagglutinin HbhA
MSNQNPNQSQDDDTRNAASDLASELREMGQQLEAAFRAAIESEQAKQLQRDLVGGVHEMSTQIKATLQSLQSNPRIQQAEERGRQMFAQARESKAVHDLQETIVNGIAHLNNQLRKLVDRLESDASASPNAAQDVPIEREPATGETTRLDDNQ